MKSKMLVIIYCILCILSCQGKDSNIAAKTLVTTAAAEDYKEVRFTSKSDYTKDSENYLEISFNGFLFKIKFVDERAYLKTDYKNKTIKDFQQVIYNFTYDSDYDSAQKNIRILYNGKDGYLFLPGYTEEFPNFTVYRFSQNSFSYDRALMLKDNSCNDGEIVADGTNAARFFIINKKSGKKCDFVNDEPYPISTDSQNKDLLKLKNAVEDKNDSDLLNEFSADLNKDGKTDKIQIFKNENAKDDFEKSHFGLPIKVLLSGNDGSWRENSNSKLIFSNDGNCTSEGFSNVVTKDSYFTVELQSCYDYNVLVSGFITFKVEQNKIWLHKYGEEYFDKSNHEKKIPSKVWTQKDFGKIKFEDVDGNFLLKLKRR